MRADEVQTVTLVIHGPTPKKQWTHFTREMQELLHKHSRLNVRVRSIVNEPKPETASKTKRRGRQKTKRTAGRRG